MRTVYVDGGDEQSPDRPNIELLHPILSIYGRIKCCAPCHTQLIQSVETLWHDTAESLIRLK